MAKNYAECNIEEFERNPEAVMKVTEGITCSEHQGEEIKYYCRDHNVPCCGACFFGYHKTCCNVLDFKKELPDLLCNIKPNEIAEDLKTIETHLMKFIEFNDVMLDNVGPQVNRSMNQIREVRKKINSVLDEIEKYVKAEGNKIYQDEEKKKKKENRLCTSFLDRVRGSQSLLLTIHKRGSDLQKFVMTEKLRENLRSYIDRIGEKYEKIDTVSVKAELSPTIQSLLSASVSELGKVKCIVDFNSLPFIGAQRHSKNCQIQMIGVVGLRVPRIPRFTGVTFLPGDRLLLLDNDNSLSMLFCASSYQFIASYQLPAMPWDVCVLDGNEIAVSFIAGNTIHVFSVVGDVIKQVRKIPTKFNCNGIASAGKGEMVVNWYCGKLKSEWSLINAKGEVTFSHSYDCPHTRFNVFNHYVAMNNAKTRVLISADTMNSLICFSREGKWVFTYKPGNLADPKGVAVDKCDNIYVVAQMSNSIHQLSPNGFLLQVIDSGVPTSPHAICIHESKDIIVVTSTIDQTILHIYQVT